MSESYIAARLFDGKQMHHNQGVRVENGQITAILTAPLADAQRLSGLLVPGFVDVQVNGGGGVLFNASPTPETLQTMFNAHCRFGTTAMMPTLITDELEVIKRAADTVAAAVARQQAGILGIHFEGPHLSVPKRGIHKAAFIRSPSAAEIALYLRQDLGRVMVTLAPETVSPQLISELVDSGVKVCLGHSNADADTVLKALEAGASGFTHLFNAMSAMNSREPGMVGVALADDDSYCGLILDHFHVHAVSARAAIKAKGADRIMLVTDAMAHVGTAATQLPYFEFSIFRTGDKLTLADGTLAGSALDMASAVRHCHRDLGLSLIHSLQMASATPAAYLGLEYNRGYLLPGFRADMVLLDDKLQVKQSWIGGRCHFAQRPA